MKMSLFLAIALVNPLAALTIKIDYTYDTTKFFDTPTKRNAIEAVAKFYGDLIQDTLLRIDPAEYPGSSWIARPAHPVTGATIDIPNLVVPLDTMIVYVGARDLGGSTLGVAGPGGWGASGYSDWFTLIYGRGNPGAETSNNGLKTDFAPWGGSMTFDIDTIWNFSTNQNLPGQDFVKIAMHEMGHVLGIGTADCWFNKIAGNSFTGAACIRSRGSQPALQSDGGHFAGTSLTSPAFGSFGMAHGTLRPVLMLASSSDDGLTIDVASDLDLAALIDIGWNVSPALVVTPDSLGPSAASFSWNSSSFFDYKLQRSSTLTGFNGGSGSITGNGLLQSWTDPAPPADAAFYRLARTQIFTQPAGAAALSFTPDEGSFRTATVPPRLVEGCFHAGR